MSTFNPDRAEPVDESADVDELDVFLARLDSKAKSFRTSLIADAFKELASVAKAERGKLLEVAAKEFATAMDEALAKVTATLDKTLTDAADQMKVRDDRMAAQADSLSTKLGRMEKLVRDIPTTTTAQFDPQPILSEVRSAIAGLKSDTPEADEGEEGDTQIILSAIQQLRNTPPPPRATWNFRVQRNDYGTITNVVATAQ